MKALFVFSFSAAEVQVCSNFMERFMEAMQEYLNGLINRRSKHSLDNWVHEVVCRQYRSFRNMGYRTRVCSIGTT